MGSLFVQVAIYGLAAAAAAPVAAVVSAVILGKSTRPVLGTWTFVSGAAFAPDESRWLVFDAAAVSHIDATGLEASRELAVGLPRDGIGLAVARMKPPIHDRLAAGGVAEAIGEECFLPTVRAAIAACLEHDAARVGSPV